VAHTFGIVGVPGKMAARVISLAAAGSELRLVAALARPDEPALGRDSGEASGGVKNGVAIEAFAPEHFARADVWIEFAHAAVTEASAAAARRAKKALLVCTTGLDATNVAAVRAIGAEVPVMIAPNTSLGVAVLNAALRLALRALGPSYAAEVVELHHDKKKDAPSGTAMRLVQTVKDVRGLTDKAVITGREGMVGERTREEIGVFAVRGGNVIGEHTVYLFGENDRIELTHRAQSRDLFAAGALRAASWLAVQPAGFYTIEDCLGIT
jgi:4-hydroxy-tetrahydrodipicolinate reductase